MIIIRFNVCLILIICSRLCSQIVSIAFHRCASSTTHTTWCKLLAEEFFKIPARFYTHSFYGGSFMALMIPFWVSRSTIITERMRIIFRPQKIPLCQFLQSMESHNGLRFSRVYSR
jgi:hypothetical protein